MANLAFEKTFFLRPYSACDLSEEGISISMMRGVLLGACWFLQERMSRCDFLVSGR